MYFFVSLGKSEAFTTEGTSEPCIFFVVCLNNKH